MVFGVQASATTSIFVYGNSMTVTSTKGGLMAARYHATSQQCVDRATVEAVAAKRGLRQARLNWCEDTQVASASATR